LRGALISRPLIFELSWSSISVGDFFSSKQKKAQRLKKRPADFILNPLVVFTSVGPEKF